VFVSPSTLEELAEVLQREKFDRYVTTAEREEFLQAFVKRVTFIEPTEEIRICRDAKDDKFLELAVSGGATYELRSLARRKCDRAFRKCTQ
jgi:putative PIN family toxin of toxin-antitoxin system